MIAQLPALSDALSWGVYALDSSQVALARLDGVQSLDDLDEIARFLAVARLQNDVYMPTSAEMLPFVGNVPIADVDQSNGVIHAVSYTHLTLPTKA